MQAQCTPGDETTCPDPENNGEVCPAVLPNGIIGKEYEQEFTIIAPPEYEIEGNMIPLHHIKIVDVENLPPGITWQTNASDSVFMVGTYYCVLLSGVSSETGSFPLKIVVDVYINFFGNPVYATQIADSTSISLKVTWDPNGIESFTSQTLAIDVWPNPFQNKVYFKLPETDATSVKAELYSILGELILCKTLSSKISDERYMLELTSLPEGTYLLKVNSGSKQASKLIHKSH
jgi:hypothetical protein